MSDETPTLTTQQRFTSIKLRAQAEQQAQLAYNRYQRSLAAIDKQYRKEMLRAGLGVLLEGKQP